MIKHIVMWTIKDEHNGQKKDEIAYDLKKKLLDLKPKIPEIKDIEVGINSINHKKNHDVILITKFNNFDDLKSYSTHPEHLKIIDFVKSITTGRAAVDFTID